MIVFIAARAAHNADPEKIAGIFTGLMTAAVGLQGFLSYMARSMGNLAEQSGVLRDLATLFTTESTKERSVSDTTEKHQDAPSPATGVGEMTVAMNDLSFQYPSAATQTLKEITAKIMPGETVALVGKNGAGKTTLTHRVPRLSSPIDLGLSVSVTESSF